MKFILSPAKSIDSSIQTTVPFYTIPTFLKEADYLMKALAKLSVTDIQDLMHVSTDIAALNVQRNKNWILPQEPTEKIKPAASVFTGEVYKGLDFNNFTEKDFVYANEHLRILSGLYGILKPLDLMYPYRLEMGTKWKLDAKSANLYAYWGLKLNQFLSNEMQQDEVLINLASTEYAKALQLKSFNQKVITPHFKDFKNGTYKIVMMYAKNARGLMTNYIIKNQLNDPELLKEFNGNGYRFDENLSSETDWVFTR